MSASTDDATTTAKTISSTTAAAEAFLATLSDEQREAVLYASDDETKTTSWSNFPAPFVQRAGLSPADFTDEQKTAAMKVLEAMLSEEGYEMVSAIIGGDQCLADDSSTTKDSLGQYCIAFFGDTYVAWSGETTHDMSSSDGISFSISGPNVYVAFQAQRGSAGADVEGVTTSGWGHVHTICRDPPNDYADSATQQAASGMGGGAPF